jgi:uncharacterized metal-binding protein
MAIRRRVTLQPNLYAAEIERTIATAVDSRAVLDVGAEAERISNLTGFSIVSAATDLVEAGLAAHINMEIPAMHQLRRATLFYREAGSRFLH